ncbi:MAG: DinB family protein [Phycisphaerae bacterium]
MNAQDVLIGTIEQAGWVTATLLSDLSDADLLIRPVPGMNHVAWQLGHLVLSVHEKLTTLGHAMPALPAGFAAAHSKKTAASEPRFAGPDGQCGFSRKADYLALLATMREATIAAIKATPDAALDTPAPESLRKYTPTIGAVYNLIGTHEFMHHGQIVALRRKLGKPVVI